MKKIYIGDEITTPKLSKWRKLDSNFVIFDSMCDAVAEFKGFNVELLKESHGGAVLLYLPNPGGAFFYPKKELETLLNCEFINEKRPEEPIKDFFRVMSTQESLSDVDLGEPMNKLKTRDEIMEILKRKIENRAGIFPLDLSEVVSILTDEGIIQVEKDEVPVWGDAPPKEMDQFQKETDWYSFMEAMGKFSFYSWYFNKQANGGKMWIPNWTDLYEYKRYTEVDGKEGVAFDECAVRYHDKPNFFYFKTLEAREKTLAQMTKKELKLLGLGGE